MGIFFSKPKVTAHEFKTKVRHELYSQGWSSRQIDNVSSVLHGYMNEDSNTVEHGMDAKEVENVIKYLKTNPGENTYSERELKILHETLKKHL